MKCMACQTDLFYCERTDTYYCLNDHCAYFLVNLTEEDHHFLVRELDDYWEAVHPRHPDEGR